MTELFSFVLCMLKIEALYAWLGGNYLHGS